MKALPQLFAGLCVTACLASARAELSNVPFAASQSQFKSGDAIVIDQILATTPRLAVGDRVVVRGHYRLASAAKATLGLFVTHLSHSTGRDGVAPTQTELVESAAGSFELSCEISYAGALHVSFYPVVGGEAFGGVFFEPR